MREYTLNFSDQFHPDARGVEGLEVALRIAADALANHEVDLEARPIIFETPDHLIVGAIRRGGSPDVPIGSIGRFGPSLTMTVKPG